MDEIKFSKMHGIGNDYIYIECFKNVPDNLPHLAKILSDRHFGVGGDGIVLILGSKIADYRMRMFNADGSEAEMCGNAIRCVGKYLFDKKITDKKTLEIETGSGIKTLKLTVSNSTVKKVRVDMGEPILTPKLIPTTLGKDRVINETLKVDNREFKVSSISVGNPHVIIPVDEITDDLVFNWGPKIEVAKEFPNKVNVEFIKIINENNIEMRVWERGTGETLACGTGACAVAVASNLMNLTSPTVNVHLKGGILNINWNPSTNHILMTGPAQFTFEGTFPLTPPL